MPDTATHSDNDSLFAPLTLPRGPAWKNRFMLAPMTNTQSSEDGTLGDDEYNWLMMRAKGGHSLVMTCAAHVQSIGKGFPRQLGIWDDSHLPGLKRLADGIRANGAISSVQLHHAGIRSPSALIDGRTPVGPSETSAEFTARALTLEEVEQLKEDFIAGAVRAEKAGFDGVELHGAHGYILAAFNSAEYNQRTDAYGGSFPARIKFVLDILDGIRIRTGPNFQLGLRLSPELWGHKMSEQLEFTKMLLEGKKLDYIDLSLWDSFKAPAEEEYAGKLLIQWFTEIPRHGCRVGVAGKLYSAEDCRRAIDEFGADFVVMGRASLLHHDLPELIKKDANWKARATPVSPEYLKSEGLTDNFINYLRFIKGLVDG